MKSKDFFRPTIEMASARNRATHNHGIRIARPTDAKAVLEIYSPYITDSAVSFEISVPSQSEFESRMTETLARFPWLVLEDEGQVVGYAYASSHRSRCAYNWSVEASVYVSPDHRKKKIASRLYTALFEILKKQGVLNVYSGITLPNEASVSFHESMGFSSVGVYHKVGFKLEKWHDVGWWQLRLLECDTPSNVIPFYSIQVEVELGLEGLDAG